MQDSNLKLAAVNSPGLSLERAALRGRYGRYGAFAWTLLTSLIQRVAERYNRKIADYDAAHYRREMQANTDFESLTAP